MIELPVEEAEVLSAIVRLLRMRLTPEERRRVLAAEQAWFDRRYKQHRQQAA